MTDRSLAPPAWAGLALALGGIAYLSWVLAPWVAPGGLDPVTTYASELAATDQPSSWLFRAADVAAGLLVASAAWAGARGVRREGAGTGGAVAGGGAVRSGSATRAGRVSRVGWGALLVFGLVTIADAFSPLSCAPSADAGCAARESASAVPWTHSLHVVTSVAASIALLTAVVLLTVRYGLGGGRGVARWTLVGCAVAKVGGTAWTMVEVARASVAWPWPPLLGVAQRVQVGAAALWVIALAATLWTMSRRAHGSELTADPLGR